MIADTAKQGVSGSLWVPVNRYHWRSREHVIWVGCETIAADVVRMVTTALPIGTSLGTFDHRSILNASIYF